MPLVLVRELVCIVVEALKAFEESLRIDSTYRDTRVEKENSLTNLGEKKWQKKHIKELKSLATKDKL